MINLNKWKVWVSRLVILWLEKSGLIKESLTIQIISSNPSKTRNGCGTFLFKCSGRKGTIFISIKSSIFLNSNLMPLHPSQLSSNIFFFKIERILDYNNIALILSDSEINIYTGKLYKL